MKQFLGVDQYGSMIEVELNADGSIRGFNGFNYIHSSQSYDGNEYLSHSSWSHEVKIKNLSLKTGDKLPVKLPKISKENQRIWDEAYHDDGGVSCSECGIWHASDQYHDVSYVFTGCEVFCRGCVTFEQLVSDPIESSDDLFKAKDVSNVEVPDTFEEVGVLFCDSSGFGSPGERALTKSQALERVTELLEEHGPLYAGITGIGQFQVYVTLWKRKAKKQKLKRGA